MLKKSLLALSAFLLLPLPALAEDGCDGGCRGGHRGGREWNRGHDRYYNNRHYSRPRSHVSINVGAPYYYQPYYRPRVIYAPTPVVYTQPDVVYINNDNSREISSDDGRYCREYTTNARIGGVLQQTYGTACMQPDGSWEIVS